MSSASEQPRPGASGLPARGRIAGLDYGTVRIGVAITDPTRTIASPYANYTRRDEQRDAEYFQQLARDESVTLFVVGLPLHLSGQESEKSQQARQFGDWLSAVTGVPVRHFDERFTSVQAEQELRSAQLTGKRRQRRLDMVAAQIMLAAYLESTDKSAGQRPLEDT
jgi:putative Holliday junction resolvase